MTRAIAVRVPGIPKPPNELRRAHWAVRAKDSAEFREAAKLLGIDAIRRFQKAGGYWIGGIDVAVVSYLFVLPRATGDLDGLIAAAKPILDGLRDAGVLVDDSVAHVVEVSGRWERGPRKETIVVVRSAK